MRDAYIPRIFLRIGGEHIRVYILRPRVPLTESEKIEQVSRGNVDPQSSILDHDRGQTVPAIDAARAVVKFKICILLTI